jgi:EAL domain-containing protein (putative c-di-GMP-specific phosphodiesterase class I)/CHASE2 domain-containing sensor protein
VPKRVKEKKAQASPWKLLLWTAVAGFVFGFLQLGEIPEDMFRTARNSLHVHPASAETVLIDIDDASLHKVGRWPWPRRYHAQLTEKLTQAGAKRIFFDMMFESATNPVDDGQFAAALERSGRVTLAVRSHTGRRGEMPESSPLPLFSRAAAVAAISVRYNYQNAVWTGDLGALNAGKLVPTFAAALAGVKPELNRPFTLDYSIDPNTVPRLSAADILDGKFDPGVVAGKNVLIGATSDAVGDQYFLPKWGKMGGAYVHIIAAETLARGRPVQMGWIPALLLALALSLAAIVRKRGSDRAIILGGSATALLLGPALLEANLVFLDTTPALFVVSVVGCTLAWRRWRQGAMVNNVTGLPNLNALRNNRAGRNQAVIAARVLNYAEIAAALPPEQERQLVEQIVARLRVGAPERVLYQGDGGIFAWFESSEQPVSNHVEALHVLFRNPARVDGLAIDLSISFGVEVGSGRSLSNRLASALVAADEAAHDGLKWKYHDPESLEDASWKLSILSQLDDAVDKGEVWVAYQPKLDLKTRKIIGAEALARWTHPEKGPIAASEFIAAAEQHDRIGKLTDFVLEEAIASAASLNRKQPGFGMAVNLSARLLGDKGFVLRLRAMLARHGLAPHLLTLELTETAALAGSGSAFDMLGALRDLGVTIAIDDYGTGLSTLDYLKKIPASEIKIDQSFVKGMLDNRSDLVMVQSTIALAHSLERKVVAEGVEQQTVLEALIDMKCDVAQGYVIGRPMSLESLSKRLAGARRSSVA